MFYYIIYLATLQQFFEKHQNRRYYHFKYKLCIVLKWTSGTKSIYERDVNQKHAIENKLPKRFKEIIKKKTLKENNNNLNVFDPKILSEVLTEPTQ